MYRARVGRCRFDRAALRDADGQQLALLARVYRIATHLPCTGPNLKSESDRCAADVDSTSTCQVLLVLFPSIHCGKHVCTDFYPLGRPQSTRPRMGQRASPSSRFNSPTPLRLTLDSKQGSGNARKTALDSGVLAIEAGIRHIDTAQGYYNEEETGKSIQQGTQEAGISVADIYVTTKGEHSLSLACRRRSN